MTIRDKLPNLVTAIIYGFAAMGAVRYLTLLPVLDGFRTDVGAAILAVPLFAIGTALGWVFPLFPNAGQSTLFGSARWASKKEADALVCSICRKVWRSPGRSPGVCLARRAVGGGAVKP